MPTDPQSQLPPFNVSIPDHRRKLVADVREMIGKRYGAEYEGRCWACALQMLIALRTYEIHNYRIASGKVTALVRSNKGRSPGIRWTGEYTGTGGSDYHAWLVNEADERIDCSELPIEYGHTHLWEPGDLVPTLVYKEIAAATEHVLADIEAKSKK